MGSILGPQPTNEPGAPLILNSYHRLFINGNFITDIYMQCNGFFERRVWERVLRNHCSVGKSFDPARPKKLKSGNIFNKEGLVRDENVMESRNDGGVDECPADR